ncbi:hypothetical protein [Escherichia phage phiWec190]|nr:hypothetical protein [Escherichia phage phiWec188]BDU13734.1 hypothetical protein [Escherichia phage phiWec190]
MGIPYDLKLGSDNDLIMDDGDLVLTTTRTEIAAQTLGITLKTYRGEWFLNTTFGVPYLQEIIGVARKKDIVDRIFLAEIAKNIYIDTINSYKSYYDRDQRYYNMDVVVTVGADTVTTSFNTQPSEEFIYPEAGDDNAAITCEAYTIVESSNRLYRFINFVGLPENTYSTWWNEWATETAVERMMVSDSGSVLSTNNNFGLTAMTGV